MRHLDGRAGRAPWRSNPRRRAGFYRTERPVRNSGIHRAPHRRSQPANRSCAGHDESWDHESEYGQSRDNESQWNQWEHERTESQRDA